MKEATPEHREPEMLDEHDFSNGIRGKYGDRYRTGTNTVKLDDDIIKIFPDSQSVNEALRTLGRIGAQQTEAQCFVIGGVPQSGKSRLASKLKEKFVATKVKTDKLVYWMQHEFPQLGITQDHDSEGLPTVWKQLNPILLTLVNQIRRAAPDQNLIIEGYHVSPEIASVLQKQGFKAVCLGYIDIDVTAKHSDVRVHAPANHWTTKHDDVNLWNLIDRYQKESRDIQAKCLQLGVPFVHAPDVPSTIEQALVAIGAST